jgi:hypothetical protein
MLCCYAICLGDIRQGCTGVVDIHCLFIDVLISAINDSSNIRGSNNFL